LQTNGVVELKLSGRPEFDCTPISNGDTPRICPGIASNDIVCEAVVTLKLCTTFGAGAYVGLPPWLAVIEQLPALTSAIFTPFTPETVQTRGVVEANVTTKPDDAVALSGAGVETRVRALRGPKVIV